MICTYGGVAKFLGDGPEGRGGTCRGPTRKKPMVGWGLEIRKRRDLVVMDNRRGMAGRR